MRLRNETVIAKNVHGEEFLSPVLIPTMSKEKDEPLKLAHKLVDGVGRANRKVCMILLL